MYCYDPVYWLGFDDSNIAADWGNPVPIALHVFGDESGGTFTEERTVLATRPTIEVCRSTFPLKRFLNDEVPKPKIVGVPILFQNLTFWYLLGGRGILHRDAI